MRFYYSDDIFVHTARNGYMKLFRETICYCFQPSKRFELVFILPFIDLAIVGHE
jgi:hypothetical protein